MRKKKKTQKRVAKNRKEKRKKTTTSKWNPCVQIIPSFVLHHSLFFHLLAQQVEEQFLARMESIF